MLGLRHVARKNNVNAMCNTLRPLRYFSMLHFDMQLSEEEKLVKESSRHFANYFLQPKILDSFRHETFTSIHHGQNAI